MNQPGTSGYDPFDAPDGSHDNVGGHQGGGYQGVGYQGVGYQGGYSAGPATGYAPSKGTGLAIAALILGILAIPLAFAVVGGVMGIVGIILAAFALRRAASARKLGVRDTGGTTAMSIIGILASVVAIVITAFMVWAIVFTVDSIAPCEHLIDDPAAFEQCINDQLDERLGLN